VPVVPDRLSRTLEKDELLSPAWPEVPTNDFPLVAQFGSIVRIHESNSEIRETQSE
jgi:hypothetical protein